MATVAELLSYWPELRAFTITHLPETSYHIQPDPTCSPAPAKMLLPKHKCRLTSLSLRETLIDDRGLMHLISKSHLRQLSIMSCEGITSSSITKEGLVKAIKYAGRTVEGWLDPALTQNSG